MVFLFLCLALPSFAEVKVPPDDGTLLRFEFDNDLFLGSDDFFTAGWSIQCHSPVADSWDGLRLSKPSRWIAKSVPGLSGGNGRKVRKGIGAGQLIQTPEDLSQTELIVDDVPYAGVLGIANSWMALDNTALNAFQIYLGILGPASLAEQTQTFIHTDLGFGEDPKGWDNQLENEPIINLNYTLSRKLAGDGATRPGFGSDLAGTIDLGLGNLFTHAQVGLEGRVGWGLPKGFAPVPDIPGRGIHMAPVLDAPRPGESRFYFSAVLRGSIIGYTVFLDGNTFRDSHSVDYNHDLAQLLLGVHFEHGALGLHYTVYISSNPIRQLGTSGPSWGNISLDYRF